MPAVVDNTIYGRLGERWYEAQDDPVALLRAEARLRNPWVLQRIEEECAEPRDVLDVGCGAGFLSNALGARGHRVTGVDASPEALAVAARRDASKSVAYFDGDALSLPFEDETFDVVCTMDFLEHVEDPARAVSEAARVLRRSGLFFFHTFNRNFLSWLIVIKGVEWFVKNTPRDMHVLRLFVKPTELGAMCAASGLEVIDLRGSRPAFGSALARMIGTGVVPKDFEFVFTASLLMGYSGVARKRS